MCNASHLALLLADCPGVDEHCGMNKKDPSRVRGIHEPGKNVQIQAALPSVRQWVVRGVGRERVDVEEAQQAYTPRHLFEYEANYLIHDISMFYVIMLPKEEEEEEMLENSESSPADDD